MRTYRWFLDLAEELTTGAAQTIVVNSQFTQNIFLLNFPYIAQDPKKEGDQNTFYATKHLPEVLYPAINLKVFEKSANFDNDISKLIGR